MDESLLLSLALVVFVGMFAQWLAWRIHLPSILLLLIFGFIVGPVSEHFSSSGERWVDPDAMFGDLLFPIVSLFVGLILFEGGLTLSLGELREVSKPVRNLMSIGVVVTWFTTSFAAWYFLQLDVALATLFGAILTVTGPTVIGPLLRHVRPSGRVGPILKWEGIVNDPIGAMLSVLVFEAILLGADMTTEHVLVKIGRALLFGIGGGLVGAGAMIALLKRYWIPDFLHSAMAVGVAVMIFAGTNHFEHECGLLAVTVMGIILANQSQVNVNHIVEFKENLRVLLISLLFIILSARLELSDLNIAVNSSTICFLLALILVIRPLSVFLSTIRSGLEFREKLFLSWMAPRGIVAAAVASVFALRIIGEGGDSSEAERLVPLMFVTIVTTVSVYGLTAAPVARLLKLSHPNPQGILFVGAHRWARDMAIVLKENGFQVLLVDTNWENTSAARMAGLSTFYGSALSDYAVDEMDLDGVGRLIAMTPNDEVNSLAAMHFRELFGRSRIYQIAVVTGQSPRKESTFHRGRQVFSEDLTYARLDAAYQKGFRLKSTTLSKEFNSEDYELEHEAESIPLFLITGAGQLQIFSADHQPMPKEGQTLLALVPHEKVADAEPESKE